MFELVRDLLMLVFSIVELLLSFRFIFKLLGANASAPIIAWVYDTTAPLLQPFLFAFPTPSIKGGFTLEFTTLFALFGYAFIAYLVQEVLNLISGSRTTRT